VLPDTSGGKKELKEERPAHAAGAISAGLKKKCGGEKGMDVTRICGKKVLLLKRCLRKVRPLQKKFSPGSSSRLARSESPWRRRRPREGKKREITIAKEIGGRPALLEVGERAISHTTNKSSSVTAYQEAERNLPEPVREKTTRSRNEEQEVHSKPSSSPRHAKPGRTDSTRVKPSTLHYSLTFQTQIGGEGVEETRGGVGEQIGELLSHAWRGARGTGGGEKLMFNR